MIRWRCKQTGRVLAIAYPGNGGWIAIRYDKFYEWYSTEELAINSLDRSFAQ